VALAGCAVTERSQPVAVLGDNAQLRQRTQDQKPLIYVKPSLDWTKYISAILMPVQVWDSSDTTINQHEQTMLSS
jgi:hypothetical protein